MIDFLWGVGLGWEGRTDGWMDGWDRWVDRWMDGWIGVAFLRLFLVSAWAW